MSGATLADPAGLIAAYHERLAICLADGITEDDARRIAGAETGADLDALARRQVEFWRAKIATLGTPTDKRLAGIRAAGLVCLAEGWVQDAAALGWNDAELFGLHRDAPTVRIEAMGLITSLALTPFRPPLTIAALTSATATIRTGTGATLTCARFHPGIGAPVWTHPAFTTSPSR